MTIQDDLPEIQAFCDILGLTEEPLGLHYTPLAPQEGFSPQAAILPTAEMEAAGEVDWEATFANFSCVIGMLWRARKLGKPAYFDQARFGCLGGAFYLGFLKPQLEFITHYVSTGQPGIMEGECYLDSPETVRRFFETLDPRPAPEQFCVFKQLSKFTPDEKPEVVIFFGRAETISRPQPTGHLCHQRLRGGAIPLRGGLLQHRRLAPEIPGAGPAQGGPGRLGPLGPQVLQARRDHLRGALRDVRPHG